MDLKLSAVAAMIVALAAGYKILTHDGPINITGINISVPAGAVPKTQSPPPLGSPGRSPYENIPDAEWKPRADDPRFAPGFKLPKGFRLCTGGVDC